MSDVLDEFIETQTFITAVASAAVLAQHLGAEVVLHLVAQLHQVIQALLVLFESRLVDRFLAVAFH